MRRTLPRTLTQAQPSDIAVIGMAAVFPGAADTAQFWSHTLRGIDAITEVPADRWDWRLYYDPDPKAPDKIISKWGGFLPDVTFDPLHYGMPPTSLPSIEPAQLLALEVVRTALADAGYADRPFPREQTAVVLGMGGGAAQLAMGYAFRSYLPMLDTVISGGGSQAIESCRGLLPEWTEDSFPGFLLNVTAGRIANRLNLGGANYTVDAACGSSLAAAALAVRELETGAADMVILGGVDTVQNPFTYLAFSKTQAFSPRGRCRPFDAGADGIVISEGVAALVLKRLADAERDGDRIYAVIKGVGASSDGRARGLTAPVVERPGPGPRACLRQGRDLAGHGRLCRGARHRHGAGRRRRDRGTRPGLPGRGHAAPRLRRGIGQVADRPHQVRRGTGRADQRLAGAVPPGPAADDRHRSSQPQARPRGRPVPALHSDPALAPSPRRPPAPGGGQRLRFRRHQLPRRSRGVRSQRGPAAGVGNARLAGGADGLASRPTLRLVEPLDQLDRGPRSGARPALCDLSHALIRRRTSPARRAGQRIATLAIVAASHDDLRDKLTLARTAIAEGRAGLRRSPGHRLRGRSRPGPASRWRSFSRARAPSRPACSESWPSCFPKFAGPSRSSIARSWRVAALRSVRSSSLRPPSMATRGRRRAGP